MTFSPAYGYYDVTNPMYAGGATGNGTTDDAPAIQAAELACESTGGVLYFPPGTYLIKSTIPIVKSNLSWMGAGAGASTLLLSSTAGTTTPMVTVAANIDNVIIAKLTFQGNSKNNGSGGSPGADAITFGTSGGSPNHYCKVTDCKFTLTTPGPTLHFWGTLDGEVTRCHFFQVGYDNGTNIDANVTPAVLVEGSCTNVRVHHNHFEQCFFDGARIKGLACEVSYNYFLQCHGSSIDVGTSSGGSGNGVRVFSNYIDTTKQVGTGATTSQGINLSVVEDFQLLGNTVCNSDGNGITSVSCTSGAYIGNICFDNRQQSTAGTAGMYYSAGTGTNYNRGLAFVGNVLFDDQATATQTNNMQLVSSGASATELALAGNSFWSKDTANVVDISIDATVLADSSDVAIANVSWIDRQHETSSTLTGTIVKTNLVPSPSIAAGSMRTTNGLRIVAGGKTVSGTSPNYRKFFLGLNASGNLLTFNAGSADADWQLVAYVVNDGAFNSQHAFVQFWYGGTLYQFPASTPVNTSHSVPVIFEGQLGDPGDQIVTHFLSVERV